MAKYTKLGSDDLDRHIDADMRRIAEVAAPHCQAGVLLGGYGRGEGTPLITADGSQQPFNDYDLIVIVENKTPEVRKQFQQLEQQLGKELGLAVDLYPYREATLGKCEFSLLNYEMKYGHRVIWGNEQILDAMPAYPHDAIPLSEGTRLLMNRGKLLLNIKHRLEHSKPLTEEECLRYSKFLCKVKLALGDSALLASRHYDISYDVKAERIVEVSKIPDRDEIVNGYLEAVKLKNWGDYPALSQDEFTAQFRRVRDLFLHFFLWYRGRYSASQKPGLKSTVQNLLWTGRPVPVHPRERLYDALPELLTHYPDEHYLRKVLSCRDNFADTFYKLQRRFS